MNNLELGLRPGLHRAIGLMSGTSHDGITAALVEIDENRYPEVTLSGTRTYPYAASFRRRLLAATGGESLDAATLSTLNFALGRALAHAAVNLARKLGVALEQLSFIASHGHTAFHLPPGRARKKQIPSTLQIGESAVIAALTGVPVVADFRPMDLALGGEGSPLAPLAHLRLFGDSRLGRVVQNLGGIGNATYLPPGAQPGDPRLIAFDTGPGNGLIDLAAMRISRGRLRMDRDGQLAARGTVNQRLLAQLMRAPYFTRRPPKSTGREEFGPKFSSQIANRAARIKLTKYDLMATVTALTARSLAQAVRQFVMPLGPVAELIVTGGGAHNPVLLGMIQQELAGVRVMRAEDAGVNGDALEAIAFAILGYEMLRGRPGNLPSVTGARAFTPLGKLTLPPGYRS